MVNSFAESAFAIHSPLSNRPRALNRLLSREGQLAARDTAEGNNTGWQPLGTWTVRQESRPRYHEIVTVEELDREYQPLREQALAVRRYL